MSPLFAISSLVCLLFCGLTLDLGRIELVKARAQNAADAAAVGAELESERAGPGASTGPFDWATHGQQDAALNGFTNGQNGATVSVIQNPTSGPYAGRYDAIQVTITQTVKTIFMGTLHGGIWTLTAQSVALVPPCSYFLGAGDATYTNSFSAASANLLATCPVYSNYNLSADGFARAWGFGLNVSGSAANSGGGGWTAQQTESGYGGNPPRLAPTFGVAAQTDPLANVIIQPAFGSCTYTSTSITGTTAAIPGTYCGTSSTPGLTLTNASVFLYPGLYIITGGANITKSTLSGSGVTIFLTRGNGAGYGQVAVSQQSTINVSAPVDTTHGGVPGVVFFGDRNWVASSSADFSFSQTSSFTGDGIWYLPNTGVSISSSSMSTPTYGSMVVRNVNMYSSQVTQNANFSWLSGGNPFRTQTVLVQ